MAKRDAHLIVGLPHAGLPVLTAALEQHRTALGDVGVHLPARSADEVFRAAVEVRREHRAWALRRKDVEGSWARICRRALKHKSDVVVGHELFAGAAPDAVDLVADGLTGLRVHVVVVVGAPDPLVGLVPGERDLADVVARWERATRSPDRVHVLVADPEPSAAWSALGDLVGFDAELLPLAHHDPDAGRLDVHTLALLAESSAALLGRDELDELVARWAKVAAEGGYDVRGDLAGLTPRLASGDVPLAALRSALAETVAEVGRLRGRVDELSGAARRPRRLFAT